MPQAARVSSSWAIQAFVLAVVVFGVALLGARPATAWHKTGHMVVAQIAYDRLSPEVRAEVDRLIVLLADHEPRFGDAITASVWLDEIRSSGWYSFDTWHYVNLPFNAEGLETLPASSSGEAVKAIRQSIATLSRPDAPDIAKAILLRVLLHVVGDLHQPLHCTSRFTVDHPEGDRGGNEFPLAVDTYSGWTNLHRLWDSTAGLLPELEADAAGRAQTAELAFELLRDVPASGVGDWQELDPAVWAREGFRLSTSLVYVGITEGRPPSEIYRRKAQLVIRRRLVTAGLRLAAVLEAALSAQPAAYSQPTPDRQPTPDPQSTPGPQDPLSQSPDEASPHLPS